MLRQPLPMDEAINNMARNRHNVSFITVVSDDGSPGIIYPVEIGRQLDDL